MPLHLNLNHELEKKKAERRRDPLKLSMMALGVVVAGFAAQYFWHVGKNSTTANKLKERKAAYAKLAPAAKEAVDREAKLQKTLQNAERMVRRIENRFYWAPLVQQLIEVVPRDVQITRIGADASGEAVKRVQFNIDGVSAGVIPRKVAEDFRVSLIEKLTKKYRNVTAEIRSLEDSSTETAKLDGKSLPTATFSINVQFQSGDEPAATPVPRQPKTR